MVYPLPKTAYGMIVPATPEEIAREDSLYPLCTDTDLLLVTDWGDTIARNTGELGYTNPNLHRRIDQDVIIPPGSDYPFVIYDKDGNAYKQAVTIGVWDRIHSYRTTETFIHDEESETCEIP